VLSDVVNTFFNSIVILTPDDSFLVVPVLLSVGDLWYTKLQIVFLTFLRLHVHNILASCRLIMLTAVALVGRMLQARECD
jgi:ABC-type amino acid transport system permease subunit